MQTAGSAGESIAFGLGVTMPAIMILGFDLEIGRVMLVGLLGGLLGILMMIPLRRALIVAQHGILKYPEGTACAEVLKAGASKNRRAVGAKDAASPTCTSRPAAPGLSAATIFAGFGLGLAYKTLMSAGKLWKEIPETIFKRAAERRLALRGNLSGTARRRLHHRPQNRRHYDGRRRPQPPCADPAHRVLWRTPCRGARPRHETDQGHVPGRNPWRLCALHWRRRGRRRWYH